MLSIDDTRGFLDTLDLHIQRHESSTEAPLAEPLEVALVQRGVKDTDVLNHLGMHATRLNTYVWLCEEVCNIMLTRGTLMNTAEPMDSGALSLDKCKDKGKGKGKKGDKGKGKENEPRQRCSVLQLREEGTPKA